MHQLYLGAGTRMVFIIDGAIKLFKTCLSTTFNWCTVNLGKRIQFAG